MALAELDVFTHQEPKGFSRIEALTSIGGIIDFVPNHQSAEIIAKARNMTLAPRLPGQPGWAAVLVHPDIPISDPPAQHDNGSEALYAVNGVRVPEGDEEIMLYLFGLPPGGKTSRPAHTHGIGIDGHGIIENYILIGGSGFIGEGENKRPMNQHEAIPPHIEHPIEAGPEGLFAIIILRNTKDIPDDQIHIYESDQPKEGITQ